MLFQAMQTALQPSRLSKASPPATPSYGSPWQLAVWIVLLVTVLSALAIDAVKATTVAAPEPCPPVRYRVAVDHAPASGLNDIHTALARVSQATGLTFIEAGQARTIDPTVALSPGEVVIEWVPGLDPKLERIGTTASHRGSHGVTGRVTLNADATYPGGFATRRSWGGVLLHEFGHLVGLDHAEGLGELMYPKVIDGPAEWGPDDRRLLAEAGRALGCRPPHPPG